MKTVELIVVRVVVVICVVELVVVDVRVVDVDVSVELIVAVAVAVCAGDVSRLGFAKDGEVARRTIRNTSVTPRAIASTLNHFDRLVFSSTAHFLARLTIPTVTMPRIMPPTIDSQGKPGIPGISSVLLLYTVEVCVVVPVRVEVE